MAMETTLGEVGKMRALHVITTGDQPLDRVVRTAKAIMPFVTFLHIREKNRTEEELAVWLETLLQEGIPADKLIVNGHPHLASRFCLGAVHLPESEMGVRFVSAHHPGVRIGASVHSLRAAKDRAGQGVDYLMYGNVYETSCKPGLKGKGLGTLGRIAGGVGCPVIAVGGITARRVGEVIEAGAAGVAVRSGIMLAADPSAAARDYLIQIESGGGANRHAERL